jgi:hypothetical protein
MTTIIEHETLSREQKLAALAHIYLELHLSFRSALDAALADVIHLDGARVVTESAPGLSPKE